MKKLILLSLFCVSIFAVNAQTAQAIATEKVSELQSVVELDKKQQTELFNLEVKLQNEIDALKDLRKADPEQYFNKLMTAKEMKMVAVMELMTDDQMDKYRSLLKKEAEARGELYKKLSNDGLSDQEIKIRLMESM